jgi:O-antigen/teichoic acid export membrane protein
MVEQQRTLVPTRRRHPRPLAAARDWVLADGTLTRKASLNAGAGALDYAARIVVGLVLNPLLVGRLGDFGFAAWQVLQRLLGHATPAGGRPGEALKWVVAQQQSSMDYEAKRRQVGNAVAVWALFVPVLATVGGVLGWFAPIWLNAPAGSVDSVRLAAALLVANLVLLGLANLPQAVLQGENLGYKRLGLSTSIVLAGGALTAGALLLGTGLVGVAAVTLVTTVLSGVTYLHIVRTRVPWFGIARPDLPAVRRFVGLSWWFLLWNLVMQAMKGSDIIVLGVAGSATLVASYSLSSYVPQAISDTTFLVISAAMPGLGGLIGSGELRRAVRVRNETMALSWLFATATGATVLLWERSFLRLWVGERYYPGTAAMVLIVVMVLQLALIRTDSNVIDLTLRLRGKVLLGLASAALSVFLGWLLLAVYGLGISGLIAGFIAGRAMLSVAYPHMIGRLLSVPARRQLLSVARPAAVSALLFGVTAQLGVVLNAQSWIGLVLACVISVLAAALAALFLGLSAKQQRRLLSRLRRAATVR